MVTGEMMNQTNAVFVSMVSFRIKSMATLFLLMLLFASMVAVPQESHRPPNTACLYQEMFDSRNLKLSKLKFGGDRIFVQ